jgi:hypothetical protein
MAFNRFNTGVGNLFGPTMGQGLQSLVTQRLDDMLAQTQPQQQTMQGLEALGFNPQQAGAMSGMNLGILNELSPTRQSDFQNNVSDDMHEQQSYQGSLVRGHSSVDDKIESVHGLTPTQEVKLANLQSRKDDLNKTEKKQLESLMIAKEKAGLKNQKIKENMSAAAKKQDFEKIKMANKETRKYYDEVNNEYRSAIENDRRLKRISELTERDDLGIPLANSVIRTISHGISGLGLSVMGLDLTSLMTADAQELDKLSSDFVKGAKHIFPGRVTDADLKAFVKMIPSLSQTNEGRRRIIHNMRVFNEGAKVRKQAMDQIIRENDGNRPYNLDELVDKISKPQIDKISEYFDKIRPENNQIRSAHAAAGTINPKEHLKIKALEGLTHY